MIINNISYVPVDSDITCSMSACLAMLLGYYNQPISVLQVAELFGRTFLSKAFHKWNMHTLDLEKYDMSEMMTCAHYLINQRFDSLSAEIIFTDVGKIKLSYIKRGIPVIITGKFPLMSGRTSNTILVKGYVDDFFVVNDPKGNANSGYHDRYGENVLYRMKDLDRWIPSDKVCLLRVQINVQKQALS